MPVSFNKAWNWNASFRGPYEDFQVYPNDKDLLIKVSGGSSDQNVIYSELVNRAQNSIVAVERQIQYTCKTGNTTGSVAVVVAETTRQIGTDVLPPDYLYPFRAGVIMTVSSTLSNKYFGGRAFASTYGVCVAATAYTVTATGKVYIPVTGGFNPTGDNSGVVTVYRTTRWRKYDVIDVAITVVRP